MANIPRNKRRSYQPKRVKFDRRRTAATKSFYTSAAWRKVRAQKLHMNPLCEEHEEKGAVVAAEMVDHIKRINRNNPYDTQNGRYGEPLEFENLRSLCHSCHNRKSGKEAHEKI